MVRPELGQQDDSQTGETDAAGSLTLTIRTLRLQTWRVRQISVEMPDAPGGATCTVRKNGRAVTPVVPNLDAVGGDPPIDIRPMDALTVEWNGCLTAGITGTIFYVYDVIA